MIAIACAGVARELKMAMQFKTKNHLKSMLALLYKAFLMLHPLAMKWRVKGVDLSPINIKMSWAAAHAVGSVSYVAEATMPLLYMMEPPRGWFHSI